MHSNGRRNQKRPPMPPTTAGGYPPNSHFAVRVVKDDQVDADLPPPDFFPDLNYPPPNYFLLPLPPYVALPPYVGNPHLAPQIPPPIPPYPHRGGGGLLGDRPSTTRPTTQPAPQEPPSASQQLLLTVGPEVEDGGVIVSPTSQVHSPVDDFFSTTNSSINDSHQHQQPLDGSSSLSPKRVDVLSPTARTRHSTDDLMGLLEELCHAEMMAICGGDGNGGAAREEFGGGADRTGSPFPFDGVDMDMDEDSGIAEAFASCHHHDGSSYLDEDLLNMVCVTPTGTNTEMNGSASSRSVSVDTSAPSHHQHQQLSPSAATMMSQEGGSGSGGGERRSELDATSVGTVEHMEDEDDEEDDSVPHPIYYPSSGLDGEPDGDARRSTMPTVLASGEDFKDLILAHNRTSKPLTFLAHRVGPTVFLEGRPTEGEAGKVEEVRKEAMRSKLLYYSKMLTAAPTTKTHEDTTTSAANAKPPTADSSSSPASSTRQSKPPQSRASPASSSTKSSPKDARDSEGLSTTVGVVGDTRTKESQYGVQNSRTDFKRAFKWKVQDMNVLIGVDTPIYRDPTSGERVIMHLHDTGNDPNAAPAAGGTSANRKKKQQQKQQKQQQQSEGGKKAPPSRGNGSKGRGGGQKRGGGGESGDGVDVATNFAIEALEDDDEVDAAATSQRKGRVLGSSALATPAPRNMPIQMPQGTSPPTKVEAALESDDDDSLEVDGKDATTNFQNHDDESDVVLPHLGQDEALDMWIDAVMTNVRNVAVCLHRDGVVQGYQVVPINKLPTHSSPAFSPVTVQASATGILKWLQDSTECGTSFLIIKDSNSSELRLFDLSDLRPGAPVPMIDAYDSHPDARRRSCWRDSSVVERSLFVDPNLDVVERTKSKPPKSQKRLHEGPNSSMDLIVPPPPPSLNDIDDSPPPIQHHHSSMYLSATSGSSTSAPHAFNQFGFPFAMMCFRMAQCLPNSDAECLRLWLRTITLLPPNSEESFLPLAIAHVHAMEHYHSSSPLPDAERVALTHCRQALEALHQLRLSVLELVLLSKPHLRDQLAARDSESFTAKLIDEFADEDPEIGSMVTETKRLAIRIVKCMCAMAMQQLRGEGSKESISAAEEAEETPVERQLRYATDVAVMIGRAMENVLFAQEALALRAHEAPSGLIMANPDLTASRSPTTMSEVDFTARMGPRGGTSINTAMIPTPPLFSSRFDVMACFEVVSTLSADIASRFLQTTLDLRVAQASLPTVTSPPTAPAHDPPTHAAVSTVPSIPDGVKATLIETFVAKLNRDIKVTLAVMNTAWRVRSSGLTGVESSTPEHINFIERLTPFYEDPIKTFDAASALYHVALAYNNILFSGRGAAVIALKRKIAGLNALVAEMYSRNLVGVSSSTAPTDANSSSQQQQKIPPPMTKGLSTYDREEKAMQFYDRAAKSFIQCRDYPNAARNFINAAKMSLRSTPLSSGGVAALSKAAFPRSEEAVAIAMRPVHAAIDFLELIDRFGSHLNSTSARSDTVSAVVAEAQQMLFNVYTFAFRARSSFFINPVTGELNPASPPYTSLPMTAAVESFLHDRYLNPASRLPKKFAKIASTAKGAPPEETVRRASEVKVLQMMLSLHWQCGSPTAPITQAPPPGSKPTTLTNFLKRRLNSTRHAKHRLRQLWGYMVYPEGRLVPFELFREACDIIVKKMQCEIFLITIAGSGMDVGGEVDEASLLEAIERCITAVSELRPWMVVAENNQLDRQQASIAAAAAAAPPPPSSSSKQSGGKKSKKAVKEVEVEYVHLQEVGRALGLIPSLLSTTLVSLLRLMKQSGINPNAVSQAQRDAEQQNVRSIITKCLALTTQTEAGVRAPDVIGCLDMATNIFKGKKRKQGGGPTQQ